MENEDAFPPILLLTIPTDSQLTVLTLKGCFIHICTEFIPGTLVSKGKYTWVLLAEPGCVKDL
jgi:hypothetical protein